jgi:hypothetical protein
VLLEFNECLFIIKYVSVNALKEETIVYHNFGLTQSGQLWPLRNFIVHNLGFY